MQPFSSPLEAATRLALAALVGLAVGIEREWSGHASGPQGRFAGVRTFFILGIVGGVAGLGVVGGLGVASGVVLAGATALVVAAYVMAVRRPDADMDATTEAAALAVLALALLAGAGELALAAGGAATVTLALREKERLHWLVRRIGETELHAALQFSVLALVVLPLLPAGPFTALGIRPRALWSIVVLLSGINFAGYLAMRAAGPSRGIGLTGLLGGIVSSTAVTLSFARRSRTDVEHSPALANGVIAACSVLPLRVLIVATAITPAVGQALVRFVLPPIAIAGTALIVAIRRSREASSLPAAATEEERSPLNLRSAIQMAAFFQLAMIAIDRVRDAWGSTGVIASGAVLGMTDVDALTVSMARMRDGAGTAAIAAVAIAVGILSNTALKLAIAIVLGSPRFRSRVALALLGLGAATTLGFVF
jgi:uncharacterized membrane protein (DUF4010 family)